MGDFEYDGYGGLPGEDPESSFAEEEIFDEIEDADELREYEMEFDLAAREAERKRRSPAMKILVCLIALALVLALSLGIGRYLDEKKEDERKVSISFVCA